MPNFFVEAVTIAGGKVITQCEGNRRAAGAAGARCDVAAVERNLQAGTKRRTWTLKLTDSAGKPFVGSTVVAIYDKAVEYISGGSNVEDIKAFFWKWRRTHYPQSETNLMREFGIWCRSSSRR